MLSLHLFSRLLNYNGKNLSLIVLKTLFIIVLFVIHCQTAEASNQQLEGVITRVSDGDTVWITPKKGDKQKIRLDRIDAPESRQEYGKEAAQYLRSLVKGKKVKVKWKKRDRYKRILGILLDGVEDINLKMVATGNAWHYKEYDKTPSYGKAERKAKKKKLGLWSRPNPIYPAKWRKQNKRKSARKPKDQSPKRKRKKSKKQPSPA